MTFPQWAVPLERLFSFPIIVTDAEKGPVYRRKRWGGDAEGEADLRGWRVGVPAANVDEKNQVEAEFNAAKGSCIPVSFTPPGETPLLVQFQSDSFRWSRLSASDYLLEIEVEEIRKGITR